MQDSGDEFVESRMSNANLGIYLNDHVAGSVVALELLEYLEKSHADTDLARFLARLRADILDDRTQLEALMGRLAIPPSTPRKAIAWIAEKLAEIKLSIDDRARGSLFLFEALETIAIGIDGKRALWCAIAAARVPGICATDLQRLQRRAQEQRDRIETARLEAARIALRLEPDLAAENPH